MVPISPTIAALLAWIAGVVAFAALPSAGQAQAPVRSTPGQSGSPAADTEGTERAMQMKLAGPIACINQTLSHLETSRRQYAAVVARIARTVPGGNTGLTLADRPSFKIEPYERSNEFALGCADALDKSAALPPAIPDLDAASRDLATLLRAIVPLANQADTYYGQEDWKDDHFARGRLIDAELGPKLAGLSDGDRALRAVVLREQAGLRKRQLDEIEQAQGRTYHWHALDLMYTARLMVDALAAAARDDALTEDRVAAAIAPLQEEFDAGTAYAAAHGDEAKPDARGFRPLWFDLQTPATILLQQAKDLHRRIPGLAGRPDAAQQEAQALGNISHVFNSLVETFNTLGRLHQ